MNFSNKLDLALLDSRLLSEEPLGGSIEAAIDEYIDRYNGDKAAIYNHLLDDLYDHYHPQLAPLHERAIQCESTPRTRNTTGRRGAQKLSQLINRATQLLLRPDYPPTTGRDAEFANRVMMLRGIGREIVNGRYDQNTNQKIVDSFLTLLKELVQYLHTVSENVQTLGSQT